jgi:hypothetical protein
MQVIGVAKRRYFNGHSEMTIILRDSRNQEVDMPASVEQVGMILGLMEEPAAQAASVPPAERTRRPPAPLPGMEDDEEQEAIRLASIGGFGPREDEDDPL